MGKDMNLAVRYDEMAEAIKTAILQSQYRALQSTNQVQLQLYYAIGRYISLNSRKDFWGTGALSYISNKLRNDMPGLRGFSKSNLKNMRMFYEQWSGMDSNSPVATGELPTSTVSDNSSAVADEMPEKLRNSLPDVEELKKLL